MNKQIFSIAVVATVLVVIDGLRYFIVGTPTVLTWNTLHPLWVGFSIALLFSASYFSQVHRPAFWIHFGVFVASYINIYFSYTIILNSACMLFNLFLATLYYFSEPPIDQSIRQESAEE